MQSTQEKELRIIIINNESITLVELKNNVLFHLDTQIKFVPQEEKTIVSYLLPLNSHKNVGKIMVSNHENQALIDKECQMIHDPKLSFKRYKTDAYVISVNDRMAFLYDYSCEKLKSMINLNNNSQKKIIDALPATEELNIQHIADSHVINQMQKTLEAFKDKIKVFLNPEIIEKWVKEQESMLQKKLLEIEEKKHNDWLKYTKQPSAAKQL
jgi:hypothetical protein